MDGHLTLQAKKGEAFRIHIKGETFYAWLAPNSRPSMTKIVWKAPHSVSIDRISREMVPGNGVARQEASRDPAVR